MGDDFDREAVLAQVAERKRIAEAIVAERRLRDPEVMAAQLVEAEKLRRARLAERAGRLNLDGDR